MTNERGRLKTMKKLSSLLIIIIFGLVGVLFGLGFIPQVRSLSQNPASDPTPVISTSTPEPTQDSKNIGLVSDKSALEPSEPQTLTIPKLGVNAAVESVGEDSSGRMGVPEGVYNVGWYSPGFKPGENGSAVMAGHLDTTTGAPAVFYYVDQLAAGDQIIVTDKNGKSLVFEVIGMQSYPFDQVPLQEIFGVSDKPKLNLITCTGVWNRGSSNYSNRLVVYAELRS